MNKEQTPYKGGYSKDKPKTGGFGNKSKYDNKNKSRNNGNNNNSKAGGGGYKSKRIFRTGGLTKPTGGYPNCKPKHDGT